MNVFRLELLGIMMKNYFGCYENPPMALRIQVHQAVLGTHGVDVQYIGVIFLESLVSVVFNYGLFLYTFFVCLLLLAKSIER